MTSYAHSADSSLSSNKWIKGDSKMLPQFWFFHSIYEALASVERLSPVDALNKLDTFYVLLAEQSIETFQYWPSEIKHWSTIAKKIILLVIKHTHKHTLTHTHTHNGKLNKLPKMNFPE